MGSDSARNMGSFHLVDMTRVKPSGLNPRKSFGEAEMAELAESIKTHGVIEPIIVRFVDEEFEIIAGERRYRAAQIAGLEWIPARVMREVDDKTALEWALVENLCRHDINAIEEAEGYRALMQMGYKQRQIAEKVNRSQESVSNAVRLLRLPDCVLEKVRTGAIQATHARALLRYEAAPAVMEALTEMAVSGKVNSKEIENPEWSVFQELNRRGLATRFLSHSGPDETGCKGCAKRMDFDVSKVCLDPACFDAKVEEEVVAREKRFREQHGVPEDQPVVNLAALEYDSFERILAVPTGCKGNECEHYTLAMSGNHDVVVCLKRSCYLRLSSGAKREENKQFRESLREIEGRARAAASAPGGDVKIAAMLAWGEIEQTKKALVAQAVRELGLNLDVELLKTAVHEHAPGATEPRLAALCSLSVYDLLALAAECRLRQEIWRAGSCEWDPTTVWCRWFVGDGERSEASSDGLCTKCQEEIDGGGAAEEPES